MNSTRAIAFLAWGQKYISELQRCLRNSKLPDYPIILVTDAETPTHGLPENVRVVRIDFGLPGKLRKLELFNALPAQIGTVLFLDVDTVVIADISLGFDKAEQHGMAIAPAPHYSLADFRGFSSVMVREGVTPRGQMIYNSGVFFFSSANGRLRSVFDLALALARKYQDTPHSDQPYLTLAMEMLGFSPYALSPSFNQRGLGELISGGVRIWHSYKPMPTNLIAPDPGYLHRAENGKLVRALKVPL